MTPTTYSDLTAIRADLERWRDEDADPTEARAALFAVYHRTDSDQAKDAMGEMDSAMFEVTEDGTWWATR